MARCVDEGIELFVPFVAGFEKATVAAVRKEALSLHAETDPSVAPDDPPFPIRAVPFLRGLCSQIDHNVCTLVRHGDIVKAAQRFLT